MAINQTIYTKGMILIGAYSLVMGTMLGSIVNPMITILYPSRNEPVHTGGDSTGKRSVKSGFGVFANCPAVTLNFSSIMLQQARWGSVVTTANNSSINTFNPYDSWVYNLYGVEARACHNSLTPLTSLTYSNFIPIDDQERVFHHTTSTNGIGDALEKLLCTPDVYVNGRSAIEFADGEKEIFLDVLRKYIAECNDIKL